MMPNDWYVYVSLVTVPRGAKDMVEYLVEQDFYYFMNGLLMMVKIYLLNEENKS